MEITGIIIYWLVTIVWWGAMGGSIILALVCMFSEPLSVAKQRTRNISGEM
jgi:hypothetical protein